MMASAKWHGREFKKDYKDEAKRHVLKMGFFVKTRTVKIMGEKIYDQPQRGDYKRTGTLWNSIHTIYKEDEIAAYVGSSLKSMQAASKTGSVVFYFPYVEFGTNKMAARPSLRPAFDELRAIRGMI